MTTFEEVTAGMLRAVAGMNEAIRPVMSKAALNVKQDWTQAVRDTEHAPTSIKWLPDAIGYDIVVSPTHISAVIGYDKDKKQGPLGNLIEFGSSRKAPGLQGSKAFEAEAPILAAFLEAAISGLFR